MRELLSPDRSVGFINIPVKNIEIELFAFTQHLKRQSYSDRRIFKYEVLSRKMDKLRLNPKRMTPTQIDNFFFFVTENGYSDETSLDYWIMFKKVCLFYKPSLEKFFKRYRIRKTEKKVNILSMDEVNMMIENCRCLRHKAIVSLLYEGGFRSGELRSISKEDVMFDEHGALILVQGKTGTRKVRIIRSAPILKKLLELNPKPFDFTAEFLLKVIKKLARRCNIEKRVYPHLFRHTRATHLARYLTDRELCLFFGWSPKSDMPSHYAHLSFRDLDEKIISISFQSSTHPILLSIPTP